MSSGKILLGVIAGVAAGAALGILFAPDKGANTRKKIMRKGDEYADELGDKFNEFIEGFTRKFEEIKKEAQNISKNGNASKVEPETELKGSSK